MSSVYARELLDDDQLLVVRELDVAALRLARACLQGLHLFDGPAAALLVLELQLLTGRDWPTGKEQRGWRVARGLACALDHLHTVSGTTKVRAHLHPHTMHAAAHNPRAPA